MKTISYSQFSLYLNCPKRWKLDYVDGLRQYEQNINLLFGTAFHSTIQHYLSVMYEDSAKKADNIDLNEYLQTHMLTEYKNALVKNNNTHFSSPEELSEFYQDGVAILKYFKNHRRAYFASKQHSLIGIEVPLNVHLQKNVKFTGYIDIVIKDERDGRIKIFDIKTSTAGWNKYQKKDVSKTSQMVLYKKYYAEQYGVSEDDIDIEYVIVRRKINEDLEFVPKRIQTFIPASGKTTVNKVSKLLNEFIDTCFTDDGTYNVIRDYPAVTSSGCKYCPYSKEEALCPKASRIVKNEE